jgi:hypothetical protein
LSKPEYHTGGKKTRLERAGAPAFTTLVEVLGRGQYRVHRDLAASVDAALASGALPAGIAAH